MGFRVRGSYGHDGLQDVNYGNQRGLEVEDTLRLIIPCHSHTSTRVWEELLMLVSLLWAR